MDCIAFQQIEAFMDQGGPGPRNRRYLNTVRPVAIVPFRNVGYGAIYVRICNSSYAIPAIGNAVARREGRDL